MLKIFKKKPKPFMAEVKKYLKKEYGVEVSKIKHKRTYKRLMMRTNASRIELITFVLANGIKGRAFYSPFIKIFEDSSTKGVKDEDLLVAYGGWLFLSSGLKDGFIKEDFKSISQKDNYLTIKKSKGITDIKVTHQYKIGDSEIFMIDAKLDGYNIKCAGNIELDLCYEDDTDYYNIPAIYFLLGEQVFKTN